MIWRLVTEAPKNVTLISFFFVDPVIFRSFPSPKSARMKCFASFFAFLFFAASFTPAQAQNEHERHLATLRAAHPGDSALVEFIIRNRLEGPQDVMFISNRDLLNGLCIKHCGSSEVKILDTLADGKILQMGLHTRPFVADSHTFRFLNESDSILESIDGQISFGAVEALPRQEVDSLWITLDGQALEIPRSAYQNLYNLNLCYNELFARAVMLYPSEQQEYFYLYLFGGEGSGTYMAKLIFDRDRFLTRIITDYPDLVGFDVFRWEFLGY